MSLKSRLLLLCFLAFSAALTASENNKSQEVPTIKPPKYWDRFLIMFWQLKHNAKEKEADYEKLNINSFHIDRSNATLATFAKEKNWPFYVDHTADKGYLYISKKKRGVEMDMKSGKLQERVYSLTDPQVMEEIKGHIRKNVNAAKNSLPVAYALDDEISTGSFCSPIEVDTHPSSLKKYRSFLSKMYGGSIEKLNAQYGSKYSSFDQISPKTFEEFRNQVGSKNLGKLNLSHWSDWRSYMDTYFADALIELTNYANSLDPNVPAGFVGGQGACAFGGYDWRKLSKAAQWVEAYESGANNEMIRSFWGQERPLLKTYFPKRKSFESAVWFLWYYLAHGNRGVIVWPDGAFAENGPSEQYLKLAPTFKEIQGDISKLIIDSEFQHDSVAIYYSHPSVQLTWCLDSATHGKTWPRRSSSMDNNLSTAHLTRMGWCKSLEDIGIQGNFIHMDHLLSDVLTKDKYKVLILNRALCLSDAEADKIKAFAKAGGTVIADHLCGLFDEHGKSRSKGILDDLFGVNHDLSKGILDNSNSTEVDAERGYKGLDDKNWVGGSAPQHLEVAVIERGLKANGGKATSTVEGADVLVENSFGSGKAIYMNLSSIGYYKDRGEGKRKGYLNHLTKMLKDAGVEARLMLKENGKDPYILEPLFWKKGNTNVLCLVRNLSQGSSIVGDESASGDLGNNNIKVQVTFKQEVKNFKNARTGKPLGNGKTFEVEFLPYEAGIFTYE